MTSSNGNIIFPRHWPFVRGIHWSPVNSPHKGQWHRALMFSLICAWINNWGNNSEAGDLRRHCAHYDVIVMNNGIRTFHQWWICPTSLILYRYGFYWETQIFPLATLVNIGVCKNCKSTSLSETLLLHSATKHCQSQFMGVLSCACGISYLSGLSFRVLGGLITEILTIMNRNKQDKYISVWICRDINTIYSEYLWCFLCQNETESQEGT